MLRPHFPPDCEAVTVTRPPLPMRLLRRILVGGHHTIGEHVLIAGNHSGEMAHWLDGLGFDVEAMDDSRERLATSRRSGVRFEIHFSCLDEASEFSDEVFDLIIADELTLHRENLLCLKSRLGTARLLSRLKPGGELVVVREPGHAMPHDATCWTRHLACFPGRLEIIDYPAPLLSRETWTWLTGRGRPEHFLTVTLRTPSERLSEIEWYQHAQRGLLTSSAPCCSQSQTVSHRRVA